MDQSDGLIKVGVVVGGDGMPLSNAGWIEEVSLTPEEYSKYLEYQEYDEERRRFCRNMGGFYRGSRAKNYLQDKLDEQRKKAKSV